MVEIAARPLMIESPRVTAQDVVWESHEEVAAFLAQHDAPGAEPQIFKNDRGEWVRWWLMDDPEHKRINPVTGIVESRQYSVQRRVALSYAEATRPGNDWDFVLPAEPGQTIYGQPYVWLHGGRKPEVDPGFWYAREHQERQQNVPAIRAARHPLPAAEEAIVIEQQKKLRDAAEMTDVIQAALEVQAPAPAAGGKGK